MEKQTKLTLFNIQHFSTHDGPGIRTAVFFKGCPLDCAWCHNPEGKDFRRTLGFDAAKCIGCGKCIAVCPSCHRLTEFPHSHSSTDIRNVRIHTIDRDVCTVCERCSEICPVGALELIGRDYTTAEILDEIRKDEIFYGDDGGVTLTGGEPFAQFDGMMSLLRLLKEHGYAVCIETSGYTAPERIRQAAEYTDVFLYDCKETDDTIHRTFTGVSSAQIRANLSVLDEIGAKAVLRCPIIPDVNFRHEHFRQLAILADSHPCIQAVELEPYHPLGLAKSERIGKTAVYQNSDFLRQSDLNEAISYIKTLTEKTVRFG